MTPLQAMKQALEALNKYAYYDTNKGYRCVACNTLHINSHLEWCPMLIAGRNLRIAIEEMEKAEPVDLNPATFLRLIDTIKYMVGIAERGRGYKCPDDVLPEKFLLEYVVKLEAENAALKDKVLRVVHGDFTQICSYCGWEAPPEGTQWEDLQAHIKQCQHHPASKLLAAQHRIKELRGAIISVLCDPEGTPCFAGSDGDRKVIAEALASPDNTAEIDALIKDAEQWRKRFYRQLTTNNDAAWGKFEDAQRLNWLEANPRHAQMLIDGKATDCVFYGISCAELVKLRDAIDAAMKADK